MQQMSTFMTDGTLAKASVKHNSVKKPLGNVKAFNFQEFNNLQPIIEETLNQRETRN